MLRPGAIKAREAKVKPLTFRYTARGEQGRLVKGVVRATSEITAQHLLVGRGYTPLTLDPVASPLSLEGALPSMFGIKSSHVTTFSRQLATLLESGVNLLPALQLLETQATSSQAFGRVVRSIAQDLGTGKTFAAAIGRHPTAFSEIYTRTIAVGERTGKLETVLRQMADYIEKQNEFSKKISGAMMYPGIVLVVGIVVSFILITVVLPPLSNLFTTMKVDLPLPTRMLMALSRFMSSFGLYVMLGAILLVVGLVVYTRTPRGQHMLDRFKLNIPIIGMPTQMAELARVCRSMSVLLNAGLSLQEVMDLAPQSISNSVIQNSLTQVRRGLLLGQGLTYPMSQDSFFPPLMLQMVRVGEESNTLGNNLTVLANFYEATANERTMAMLSLIQPASTIIIAGVAAFIALSVIMPMYSITGAF